MNVLSRQVIISHIGSDSHSRQKHTEEYRMAVRSLTETYQNPMFTCDEMNILNRSLDSE